MNKSCISKQLVISGLALMLGVSAPASVAHAAGGGGGRFPEHDITAVKIAGEGGYFSQTVVSTAKNSQNPLVRPLVSWMYMTDADTKPELSNMFDFIKKYPDWPYLNVIKRKIEQEIARRRNVDYAVLRKWFTEHAPLTDDGKYYYILSLAAGTQAERTKANDLSVQYWRDGAFNLDQQKNIRAQWAGALTAEDNIARLDNLIWNENYERAESALDYVSVPYKKLATARIKLAQKARGAEVALNAVPAHLLGDKGLIYERVRWRRRHDLDKDARSLLLSIAADKVPFPEKWWVERHILARRAFAEKQHDTTYKLASEHGLLTGMEFAQAEWLAGWVALTKTNNPKRAFTHFKRLFDKTTTPLSRSRGSYWAGVAAEKSGYKDIAAQWFKLASQYYETYYGQMACDRIAPKGELIKASLSKPANGAKPTAAQRAAFENRMTVRAVRLLNEAGIRDKINPFMIRLADTIKTPEEYALYAQLAKNVNHYESVLRIGKKGFVEHRWNTWDAAFPLMPVSFTASTSRPLAYGIMRQESAFNAKAESPVGARGLMQLMPATAKQTAQKNGIPYVENYLKSKPDYNVKIGQAYLGELIARYNGAYPMAIAAYNAGPSRVNQWIETYGDPRTGRISWVDWMESIPIYETRNYVQRVLEAERIYSYRIK